MQVLSSVSEKNVHALSTLFFYWLYRALHYKLFGIELPIVRNNWNASYPRISIVFTMKMVSDYVSSSFLDEWFLITHQLVYEYYEKIYSSILQHNLSLSSFSKQQVLSSFQEQERCIAVYPIQSPTSIESIIW